MNERQYRENKTKGGVIAPKSRGVNKKDTKKWCKGVVGREHQKEWIPCTKYHFRSGELYELTCIMCGKEFARCYPPPQWRNARTGGLIKWKYACKCGHHKKSIDGASNP